MVYLLLDSERLGVISAMPAQMYQVVHVVSCWHGNFGREPSDVVANSLGSGGSYPYCVASVGL